MTPETGITVAQGDVAAVAHAIGHITASPHIYTPQRCRANVGARFDAETNYSAYFNLYDSLL